MNEQSDQAGERGPPSDSREIFEMSIKRASSFLHQNAIIIRGRFCSGIDQFPTSSPFV